VIRVDIIQHVPVRAPKRDIGRSACANREDRENDVKKGGKFLFTR
jgi:hypothetical protein